MPPLSGISGESRTPGRDARRIYSVTELTARIKSLLEERFPFVWIHGEISNLRVPASGHCYFTLKDETAQIAAVMFRSQGRQLTFAPADGMGVVGFGRISVFEPRGAYQIILEYLEPAGIGALQLAYERLKSRLAAEGYFDEGRKRKIPFLPRKIGIVTSPTGAVVRDIITVATRRNPRVHLEIVPVRVQGAEAESEIVAAIELLNRRADADLVILARGGGSLEDLQAFNSERVAMAVFHSSIPVVSAVGHETDFTIADFVADLRAPTPSAAAELAVPDLRMLTERVEAMSASLRFSIERRAAALRERLANLQARLADPRRSVQAWWLRLDDLGGRLARLAAGRIERERERLGWIARRLDSNSPMALLDKYKSILLNYNKNILIFIKIILDNKHRELDAARIRLETLSPLAVLRRGYSITRTLPEGRVLLDPEGVLLGEQVEVRLALGRLVCRVEERERHGQEEL
jgi:exodeoxyribonuclease VII large subunit